MEKRRGSELIAIIGHNNTGKTVLAKNIVKMFNRKRDRLKSQKKYPDNYLRLAVFDVQNRLADEMDDKDINIIQSNKNWAADLLNLRDSLIVLDDYRVLAPNDKLHEDFLNLMQYRSEYGLDILIITHSPSLILERISYYIDQYILFYTTGNESSFKSKIPNVEALIGCKKEIDREFRKYTPDEYKRKYPNFPFIFFDNRNEVATKFNFKQ